MTIQCDAMPVDDAIAVIGMKGRFPGSPNVESLWENLKKGVESITTFSEAELQAAGVDLAYVNTPGFVNRGCILEDIDQFDARFFGYSARDAETMDPQQRLFLECAWESLEHAGYDPDAYPGMIGVFAGCDQSTYLYQIYANVDFTAYGYGGMMSIGNEKDFLTTQVSYKLNLRGPSMDIQTSCSTSLAAVCMACQSVRHGYCDMALAGGVAISTPQKTGYWYQPGGIMSPDGHCRPFDANGQGTVVGNGVGIVVLKRLSEAIADGDNILAVIKGFALNNDGAIKVGYTAPSVEGQSQAIRMAHRMAGVDPRTIGYVEAHGTATALGDPIEIAALTKAFGQPPDAEPFCAVGSLKSNVGHLSSAAGITGLIKTILTIQHGQIPPSLHFEQPNPELNLAKSPFFIASKLMDWPVAGSPRRAGVSSFGVGGTNAHIVLEESPVTAQDEGRETQVLVLSARTETALERASDNLIADIESRLDLDLADAAFTLQVGRKTFEHRRAVVFDRRNRDDLLAALKTRDPARLSTTYSQLSERPVIFMFSGQGSQYVGMGAELYRSEQTFQRYLDQCADFLTGQIGLDLRDILFVRPGTEGSEERLKQTAMSQPALFAIEYSLARLWMEWGVIPKAMLGHSIGEYVAACLAGVMTVEEALSVVSMRGRLMSSMPGGSMLAVPLPEAAVQPVLQSNISLAAVNAPALSVLSGPAEAIDALEQQFIAQGLSCKKLHTSHAFHSSMMEPVLTQFVERMSRINLQPPQIPYLSNLTGAWMTPELATSPEYWGYHLRQTVRFADNLCEVMAFPDLALLEIGPGQTLGSLAREQGSRSASQLILSSLPGPQEKDQVSDSALMAWTVGQLWLGSVKIDWAGLHHAEKCKRVVLPTYPFERERFWLGNLEELEGRVPEPLGPVEYPQEPQVRPAATSQSVEPSSPDDVDGWIYAPVWKPAMNAARPSPLNGASGSWLILADHTGLGAEIRDRLQAIDGRMNLVVPGPGFARHDSFYQIRLDERGDYDALVEDLMLRQEQPTRVLHLWSTAEPGQDSSIDEFDAAQARSFFSLVLLSQALAKVNAARPVQIGVVTQCLQPVIGDEPLRSNEATVLGACKVISQEYPNFRCRNIDIVPSDDGNADALIREMASESFHAVVAYRKGRRWLEHYEPVRLERLTEKMPLFADGGVYLITGGLGNIPLLLAEAIASEYQVKFVLTGRSQFPARELWDEHLRQMPNDPTSAKIRKLMSLENSGSEVAIVQADATNLGQMRAAVQNALDRWGVINGVIHGAANLSPDAFVPVASVDRNTGDGHFRPKAHGLLILDEVLQGQPLQFCFLLSSLSAVLGGLNLACYAASNAYLDAAARQRNQQGTASWITVDWDSWTFTSRQPHEEAVGPAEGQDCFRRIMASTLRHVVVSTTPLGDRLARWVDLKTPALQQPTPALGAAQISGNDASGHPTGTAKLHARPSLSTQFEPPKTETEKSIAAVWEQLLGVTPIGRHDKFFELGGHSLLAIQVLTRLREIFDLDLQVQRIFEAPTVAELAGIIEQNRREAVSTGQTTDDSDISELLSLVENLSEEELEALLKEAETSEGDGTPHV